MVLFIQLMKKMGVQDNRAGARGMHVVASPQSFESPFNSSLAPVRPREEK